MGVAGAVLCGGASIRMGRDKTQISVAGTTLAHRVAQVLADAGCDPVVAIGGVHQPPLASIADRFPGQGPLGGIITALGQFPSSDAVAVLAADLGTVDAASVQALIAEVINGNADVAVAFSGRREPLCAVWSPICLTYLEAAFRAGLRAVHSALLQLEVVEVAIDPRLMTNVNSPADLDALG